MTKPVYGVADTHAHFMAHLSMGGSIFWGRPYSEKESAEQQLEDALSPRGLTIADVQEGSQGYRAFDAWPRFTTQFHQQAYIDWIRRAYEGGLRLVSCLCMNNEALPKRIYATIARPLLPEPTPYDNVSVINAQLDAIKRMVRFVGERQGGWMQIAYTPQEARDIINDGKLAVILGIEIDSLGNWRKPADLEDDARRRNTDVRTVIRCEIERLYQLGVRQITPIHLIDNPFGGAALYSVLFNTANVDIAGYSFVVEDGFEAGIRYRMDQDFSRTRTILSLIGLEDESTASALSTFRRKLEVLDSHRNRLGLTRYGEMLIEEMMRLGMVIDLDHMSDRAKDKTLHIAWTNQYPVIFSHIKGFRDLALSADVPYVGEVRRTYYRTSLAGNVAAEIHARRSDVEQVRDLGGIVSVLLNQGEVRDFDGPDGLKHTAHPTVENNCAGSSRSWAQAYLYALEIMGGERVTLGSDVNGLAGLPGPRFGPYAAYALEGDEFRDPDGKLRAQQAGIQDNGIRYEGAIRDVSDKRFGGKAFDSDGDADMNRDIWQAIALFQSGIEIDPRPIGGDRAANIALGMRAGVSGDTDLLDCGALGALRGDCADERKAGYLVTTGRKPTGDDSQDVHRLFWKIQKYLRCWKGMEGKNVPLKRQYLGDGLRDYDYNLDGFAHYGMLPDFLQDLRNIGLRDEHTRSLYTSAESYIQTWEKCARRSQELFGKIALPSEDCR